jgi:ribosomal protein L28
MANKQITVTIDSGTTSTGPYNVYTTSISDDTLIESNVSLANMKTGRTYRVNTSVTQVIITNENNDCCCSTKTLSV